MKNDTFAKLKFTTNQPYFDVLCNKKIDKICISIWT